MKELTQRHIDGLKVWLEVGIIMKQKFCPFRSALSPFRNRNVENPFEDCSMVCLEYFPKAGWCPCRSSNYFISEIINKVKEIIKEYENRISTRTH